MATAGALALAVTAVYLVAGGHHRRVATVATVTQTVSTTPVETTPVAATPPATMSAPDPTTVNTVTTTAPPPAAPLGCAAAETPDQKALAQKLADGGVSCGANISPEFAVAILRAYKDQGDQSAQQSVTMMVSSPVTGKDYAVRCAASAGGMRCHNDDSVVADNGTAGEFGANNSISFELSAVSSADSPLSSLL